MKHVSFYREQYPRPQFVRDSYIDLNGEWKFEFDDADCGKREKWFAAHEYTRRIQVPFSYQTKASGIGETARHDVVWYERELEAAFRPEQRVLLNFEGVDFIAELWVNGAYAGRHVGGYTRFSFDITDYLEAGKNRITVRARDSFDTAQPRGKQRWYDQSFACFYVETNGIWKSVWAEVVSEERIERLQIVPEMDRESARFTYELTGKVEGLSLRTTVSYGDREIFSSEERLSGPRTAFSHSLVSTAHFFKICCWTPQSPCLYEVKAELLRDGKALDCVQSYFGMRRIDWDGGRFIVNHVPDYFRGVLDQGYWEDSELTPPDGDSLLKDVMLTKQIGLNGIRMHQKIEDERFYYYCDVAGIYATCEMPSNYEFTQVGCEWMVSEWVEVIGQLSNHPSIICWVPFNESWGVNRIDLNPKQQQFTRSVTELTRALDPDVRPVISNDGWEHTNSDVIGLHNYAETGAGLCSMKNDLTEVLHDRKVKDHLPRRTFAGGESYHGQPVMMTEYGGIAFAGGEGWGYGKMVGSEEEYLARLADLTRTIREMDLMCGYCYTQLTDVQQEINGLMTIDRRFKADPEKLSEIFSR